MVRFGDVLNIVGRDGMAVVVGRVEEVWSW
jgi:hypothetical protein